MSVSSTRFRCYHFLGFGGPGSRTQREKIGRPESPKPGVTKGYIICHYANSTRIELTHSVSVAKLCNAMNYHTSSAYRLIRNQCFRYQCSLTPELLFRCEYGRRGRQVLLLRTVIRSGFRPRPSATGVALWRASQIQRTARIGPISIQDQPPTIVPGGSL